MVTDKEIVIVSKNCGNYVRIFVKLYFKKRIMKGKVSISRDKIFIQIIVITIRNNDRND